MATDILRSTAIYSQLLRWLLCDELTNESIDLESVADEIHECVNNQGLCHVNEISTKLLLMYRKDNHCKHYVHQFIPLFVMKYIDVNNANDWINDKQEEYRKSLEIFMLAIYNLSLKSISHEYSRAPALNKSSADNDDQSARCESIRVLQVAGISFKPIPTLKSNTDQQNVLLRLLILFNESITSACWHARKQLCLLAICLTSSDKISNNHNHMGKALSMFTTKIAIELLSCLHFLCKNDRSTEALNAIRQLNERARNDLNPRMMLCAKAVIGLIEIDEDSISNASSKKDVSTRSRSSISGHGASKDLLFQYSDTQVKPEDIQTNMDTVSTKNISIRQKGLEHPSTDVKRKISMLDELDFIEIENLPGLTIADNNDAPKIDRQKDEGEAGKKTNNKNFAKAHKTYSILSRKL